MSLKPIDEYRFINVDVIDQISDIIINKHIRYHYKFDNKFIEKQSLNFKGTDLYNHMSIKNFKLYVKEKIESYNAIKTNSIFAGNKTIERKLNLKKEINRDIDILNIKSKYECLKEIKKDILYDSLDFYYYVYNFSKVYSNCKFTLNEETFKFFNNEIDIEQYTIKDNCYTISIYGYNNNRELIDMDKEFKSVKKAKQYLKVIFGDEIDIKTEVK